MKLFYVLLLAIVQQAVCDRVDELLLNPDIAPLIKIKLAFSELIKKAENIKEELTTRIDEESSSYIREGLDYGIALLNSAYGTMKYNSFSDLLSNCRYAADYVKNVVETKFNNILEKVDSIDMDDDDFISQFQTTVIPPLKMLIEKLQIDSVFVPANVKNCVEAYLSLVPLFENSDTLLDQLHLGLGIEMVGFGHLKQTRITEINNKSFPYYFNGWMNVRKLHDSDPSFEKYRKLLVKCTESSDATINEAKTFFDEIFKKSDAIGTQISNEKDKEIFTGDSDYITEKTKASLDYYSNEFKSKIIPDINQGFKLLEYYKISVPLEMKRCVDEVLIAMRSSRWCPFYHFMYKVLNNNTTMM